MSIRVYQRFNDYGKHCLCVSEHVPLQNTSEKRNGYLAPFTAIVSVRYKGKIYIGLTDAHTGDGEEVLIITNPSEHELRYVKLTSWFKDLNDTV